MVADRSDAGTARCSADSASMDPVQDSEAGLANRCADSASMDPVRYSEAGSAVRSVDYANTDPVRYSGVDSAGPAVPDLEPAERFRRCADSDQQPVFPGSYLYIQMNSDLRNLP